MATDSADNILVGDSGNNRVQVFNSTGQFLFKFGSLGAAAGMFNSCNGVALDSKERIIVADGGNDRLQVFEMIRPTAPGILETIVGILVQYWWVIVLSITIVVVAIAAVFIRRRRGENE